MKTTRTIFASILVLFISAISNFVFAQYTVNGNAQNISTPTNPNSFLLTANAADQNGAVWNNKMIDLATTSFNLKYTANFGSVYNGGNGIGLVFHNDKRGTKAIGEKNRHLGYEGIAPSIGLEIDTYNDGDEAADISADHLNFFRNGSSSKENQLTRPVAAHMHNKNKPSNLKNGVNYTIEVSWDALMYTMVVSVNGVERSFYSDDIVKNILKGESNVFWGFTSATGKSFNRHTVSQVNMEIIPLGGFPTGPAPLPVSLTSFAGANTANGNILNWATATEINSNYFQVERSNNGKNWTALTRISSNGNSSTLRNYNYTDATATGLAYYRLKMVDFDGTTEFSKIIAVSASGLSAGSLSCYPNPAQQSDVLNIAFTSSQASAFVQVSDLTGKIVKAKTVSAQGAQVVQVETAGLKPGMYLVQVVSGTTKETARIIIK